MAVDVGEIRGILSLQDNFSGPVNDAAKQLGVFGESFGAVTKFAGLAAGAVAAAAGAIAVLGTRGAEVNDVQEAFAGLAKGAGSTADVMLGALRSGVQGALSDFDLMKEANKALGGGMISSAKDMETLANGARELGKATGVDTKTAFESLEKAMATGRTTGLGFKGLMVDTTSATSAYLAETGKSAGELSKHEKATIGAHAVLDALNKRFTDRAPADFGEMLAQARVRVTNFTDNLGVAIAQSPVIRAGMIAVGQAIDQAFGTNQGNLVKTLMTYVNSFAIGLTYVAQGGLVAGQVLVQAFYGAKAIIAGLMTAVAAVGTGFVEVAAGLGALMAKIPGHAKWIDTFAASTRDARLYMEGLTKAAAEETVEAAKGALGHSAASQALDKLGGVVVTVRDKMEEASKSQVKINEKVKAFTPATEEAKDAVSKYAEKMKATIQKLDDELDIIGRIGQDKRLKELKLGYDKEIAALAATGKTTGDLYDQAFKKITQKYHDEVAVVMASSDEIASARKNLVDRITLGSLTGVQLRLAQLEIEKAKEIETAGALTIRYSDEYKTRIRLINEFYAQSTSAAVESFTKEAESAVDSGKSQIEKAKEVRDKAVDNFMQIAMSGVASYDQVARAAAAAAQAEINLDKMKNDAKKAGLEAVMGSMSSLLREAFGKSKAAAMVAAGIDIAAAILKAQTAAPPPFSFILMGLAAAAGAVQLAKIASAHASFAMGSPDTAYMRFPASGAITTMHGEEAVVTKAQGQTLSDQVLDAAGGGGRPIVIHVTSVLDGRKVAENTVRHMPRVLAAHGLA
jgi:hypothetical protein